MINTNLMATPISHEFFFISPWILILAMVVIFAFGFSFGWIRGGFSTLYFFSVNFTALIILNFLNEPFKVWLLKDVSIFDYMNWIFYRLFAPLILIIGGLAIVNAASWLLYIFFLRKRILKHERKLDPKRRKALTIVGAFISAFSWLYFGMMPFFTIIPMTGNKEKLEKSVPGRVLDTFYNPLSTYEDFQIVGRYKDFFVETYEKSSDIVKKASDEVDTLCSVSGTPGCDALSKNITILKHEISGIFSFILDRLEDNPELFGHMDGIKSKTIAEIKKQVDDLLDPAKNSEYNAADKVKEFVDNVTKELRNLTGLPITTSVVYGLIQNTLF